MSIRVLLIATMVVGLVASFVTVGSFAFFGDTEVSTGNIAQAGVLDIQVNGFDDPVGQLVSYTGLADIKPSRPWSRSRSRSRTAARTTATWTSTT